jgi:hypothetical protein
MGAAASLDPAHDPALRKLVNMLGAQARPLIAETLREAGLTDLITPDDRYRFACALMKRGGIYEAIGRAIKIQAILHGAAEA